MNGIFQPLYGEKPKEDPESVRKAQEGIDKLDRKLKQRAGDKTPHQTQIPQIPQPTLYQTSPTAASNVSKIVISDSLKKLKTAKSQLEGFVGDNKTAITIIVFILVLLVLAYIIYNQKKQEKKLVLMKKKLLKMK
jgi:hypothetical protein